MDPIISLCIGAKVLLIKNIAVADGLVNGVFGTVTHISFATSDRNMPESVWVKFDYEKVGRNSRLDDPSMTYPESTRIKPYEDEISSNKMRTHTSDFGICMYNT